MSTRKPATARKRPLGAALAATLEHERESIEDRFAKAERMFGPEQDRQSDQEHGGGRSADAEQGRAGEAEPAAPPREKAIRDTFSFPQSDYKRIAEIAEEALNAAIRVNKSEIVRAGLMALQDMPAEARNDLLRSVERLKTGRPASS